MDKEVRYINQDKIDYVKQNIIPNLQDEDLKVMKSIISFLEDDKSIFDLLNTSKKVIMKNWSPSKCPTCGENFYDYEPCDDGYYQRAYSLERCPYCGQKLDWY